MRKQVFTIEVCTKERDGCGNPIPALSAGDIRKGLLKGLDVYDSIYVRDSYEISMSDLRNWRKKIL